MPSGNESTRASARLQLETPISDDASLLEVQEQAAEYVREARRRAPSEPDELVSSVLDAVARDYFHHVIKKQTKGQASNASGSAGAVRNDTVRRPGDR